MQCWRVHGALSHTRGTHEDPEAAGFSWQEGDAPCLPRFGSSHQVGQELLPVPHAALSPSVERKHLFYVWRRGPEDQR